jgi:hypothetical protein
MDVGAFHAAMETQFRLHRWTVDEVTVVHGDCPTGADYLAHEWCIRQGVHTEPHPADWARYGKSAGPMRNQEMVNAGADVCLAFILNESRGATHCMRRALAAGIPVVAHYVNDADRRP